MAKMTLKFSLTVRASNTCLLPGNQNLRTAGKWKQGPRIIRHGVKLSEGIQKKSMSHIIADRCCWRTLLSYMPSNTSNSNSKPKACWIWNSFESIVKPTQKIDFAIRTIKKNLSQLPVENGDLFNAFSHLAVGRNEMDRPGRIISFWLFFSALAPILMP